MTLSQRIEILENLGKYMLSNTDEWAMTKDLAFRNNGWFIPEFIDRSVQAIAQNFLNPKALSHWMEKYPTIVETNTQPALVGLVMAGNIPLVGFHDLLCIFISGHRALIKTSSKDEILIKHLVAKMTEWHPELGSSISFSTLLKGCDAYIATGSNNTAGYFDYYFGKYPHLIRRNRTSVAILHGQESSEELDALSDDIHLYFGLGCRNVTKIFVPENYSFEPLLNAFKKYEYLAEVHKYKNNYDYNLALYLLNNRYFMSTQAILLVEDEGLFSPVSQLNYSFYTNEANLAGQLINNDSVQAIIGQNYIPFGQAQVPTIDQYADGADTLLFLTQLQPVHT